MGGWRLRFTMLYEVHYVQDTKKLGFLQYINEDNTTCPIPPGLKGAFESVANYEIRSFDVNINHIDFGCRAMRKGNEADFRLLA